MNQKYELTGETMVWEGHTLRRIKYFDGTKGGWLESYNNLSQEGTCRVLDNAKVWDGALVCDDAQVSGTARVCGKSPVGDSEVELAIQLERAIRISKKLRGAEEIKLQDFGGWDPGIGFYFKQKEFQEIMTGFMQDLRYDIPTYGSSGSVCGNAKVCDNAQIIHSKVCDSAVVSGNAQVKNSLVRGSVKVSGHERVFDSVRDGSEPAHVRDRRKVVDEVIYMIEHCPHGQKHMLLPNIASLMLIFSSSEQEEILGLYEVWCEKDGDVFAPPRGKIQDMIRRLDSSGQSPSQGSVRYSQQPPFSQGGYSSPSNPRLGDFMDDMKDVRRGQSYRGRYNPEEGGSS